MANHMRISPHQLPVQGAASSNRGASPAGYGTVQGAQRSVSGTQPMGGDEFQRAVAKLNRTLDSGEPLRGDVPRGFYLNIRV